MSTDEQSSAEAIAESMLPVFTDNTNKNKYLALRVANFTPTEAAKLVGVAETTLWYWRRHDPEFKKLDTEGMTDERKKLANEFVGMEFIRNFHLVLQQDFNVLYKSVTGEVLTESESTYLQKIRPQYTPQSLMLMKQLAGEIKKSDDWDFTKLTLTLRREKEELIIQRNKDDEED